MENPHFWYEKQREKKIGNRKVQRDLYSAFLIRNTDLYSPSDEYQSRRSLPSESDLLMLCHPFWL